MASSNYTSGFDDVVDTSISAVIQESDPAPTTTTVTSTSGGIPGLFGSPTKPNPAILDSTSNRNLAITVAQPGDPAGYVFGRTTVVPKIITAHVAGDYLYVDYFLSVGECQEIESVVLGGQDIGKPSDWEYFLGTSSQSASTLLSGVLGSSYDTLTGICHVVAKLTTDDSLDCRFVMKGLKVADPRNSPQTPAYSTNPALALARALTDCGYSIDEPSLITAANYCDESVGGEDRWTINLQCAERKNIGAWISTLAQYANCFLDFQGGVVYFAPDAVVTASPQITRTVTADEIIEGSARTSLPGVKNVPEQVTVNYREADGTSRSVTVGSGATGQKSRLQLPGIQTYNEAKRKATEVKNKAALDIQHQHVTFDDGLSDAVGDLMDITYTPHGLSAKRMRLVGYEEVERGRWRRTFAEYGDSTGDDTTYTPPVMPEVTVPSPSVIPDAPTPVLTEVYGVDFSTGISRSLLRIDFQGVNWPYALDYLVAVYTGGTTSGSPYVVTGATAAKAYNVSYDGPVSHSLYHETPMVSGTLYHVQIYIRSRSYVKSKIPGYASITSTLGTAAQLNEGDLTNMHVYVLDGDGRYATTSEKSGSPELGQTWAARFTDSPQGGTAWSAGETWLGNQTCETVFETEVWDVGQSSYAQWRWTDFQYVTELGGATSADAVLLSGAVSPISFTEYAGTSKTTAAQYFKAKSVVSDSPLVAGYGLHVKLPIPVFFFRGG